MLPNEPGQSNEPGESNDVDPAVDPVVDPAIGPVVDSDLDSDLDGAEPITATTAQRRAARRERRRVRRATPNTPDPRGPLLVLVAVGIAAAVVAASAAIPGAPATSVPPPVVEPIDASVLLCPEPGGANGAEVTSAVSIVADLIGQDRPGAVSLTYLGRPDEPVDAITGNGIGLTEPGASIEVVNDQGRLRPLVIAGEGGLAPGLVASQYELGLDGPRRGLATLNCPSPSPSWWFVGGGSTTGRTTQMYLVNPETTEAEVDISLAGTEGPISAPSLRGLVIPPESRTTVRLSRVAPAQLSAAWNVQVRTGRVAVAVQDIDAEGFVPRGIDWIPPSADPTTRVYVPGILGGDGRRRLVVHAPGDLDARVTLRVLTPDGAYVPTQLPEIEVLAGSVVATDLTPALQGSAGTLELISDMPIVASVRMRHDGVDASANQTREDISYATGSAPVVGLAAAAGMPAVRGTAAILWFTVPRPPGSDPAVDGPEESPTTQVTIRVLPFGDEVSEPDPIVVDIPVDRAVAVTVPRPENAEWFTAVVQTESSGVYVAQTSLRRGSRGTLFSGYPLSTLRTTVSIPSAGRSLGLFLGSGAGTTG